MSLHRTKATIIGLLETSRVNEWIVTEKLGDALLKDKIGGTKVFKKYRFSIGDRIDMTELIVGFYLLFCGCYDFMYGKSYFFIFLYLQAITFFILAFGYVGTFVPKS
ncbi:glucomannan 4-beta-mannosyltransferase 9-like protein [Trifolium pratense]|uniref:Glucomannan 4-beta-mannosyltransferase 9-like protein n=2 Tax=Trifolium pratense TaxID=57577 RepID=A0A2K3M9Z1_TRIPR|nr:glucomannan 4-beta-mannosyltransferase 9-like protein [Trifolium pratense]